MQIGVDTANNENLKVCAYLTYAIRNLNLSRLHEEAHAGTAREEAHGRASERPPRDDWHHGFHGRGQGAGRRARHLGADQAVRWRRDGAAGVSATSSPSRRRPGRCDRSTNTLRAARHRRGRRQSMLFVVRLRRQRETRAKAEAIVSRVSRCDLPDAPGESRGTVYVRA